MQLADSPSNEELRDRRASARMRRGRNHELRLFYEEDVTKTFLIVQWEELWFVHFEGSFDASGVDAFICAAFAFISAAFVLPL